MREGQINALRKIAELTKTKCETCPTTDKYRCCDRLFCNFVRKYHVGKGIEYPWFGKQEVPFMGDNGCIVKPEHRPFCVGYVCGSHLKDRKFKKKYFHLCNKADILPQTNETLGC